MENLFPVISIFTLKKILYIIYVTSFRSAFVALLHVPPELGKFFPLSFITRLYHLHLIHEKSSNLNVFLDLELTNSVFSGRYFCNFWGTTVDSLHLISIKMQIFWKTGRIVLQCCERNPIQCQFID